MEKIARGYDQETDIAQGKAECYIRLKTKSECYVFILYSQQCLNWFFVMAGLYKQIVKVLFGL